MPESMAEVDLMAACGFGPSPMRDVWTLCRLMYHLWGDDHGRRLLWDWDDGRLVITSRRGGSDG